MHAPYRIATPPEPIRTDEADNYEKALVVERARERIIGGFLVMAGISIVAILGVTVSNLSHRSAHEAEAKARVDARVARARAVIDEADRAATSAQITFEASMTYELLANFGAGAAVSPCQAALVPADRPVRRNAFPLLVASGADHDLTSPSVARVLADVRRAQEYLRDGNYAEAVLYADALAATPLEARLVRDVVLVPTKRTAPARLSATAFEPGAVDGTAYVYDFQQRRVICAGAIHAQSSRAIEYSWNDGALVPPKAWESQAPRLDATLDDDLETQVYRAIAAPGALSAVTR